MQLPSFVTDWLLSHADVIAGPHDKLRESAARAASILEEAEEGQTVGLLLRHSLFRRSCGRALFAEVLPRYDVGAVVELDGCFLPGVGAPLFAAFVAAQPPEGDRITFVRSLRGEGPADEIDRPEEARCWRACTEHLDEPGYHDERAHVLRIPRDWLRHRDPVDLLNPGDLEPDEAAAARAAARQELVDELEQLLSTGPLSEPRPYSIAEVYEALMDSGRPGGDADEGVSVALEMAHVHALRNHAQVYAGEGCDPDDPATFFPLLQELLLSESVPLEPWRTLSPSGLEKRRRQLGGEVGVTYSKEDYCHAYTRLPYESKASTQHRIWGHRGERCERGERFVHFCEASEAAATPLFGWAGWAQLNNAADELAAIEGAVLEYVEDTVHAGKVPFGWDKEEWVEAAGFRRGGGKG